MRYVTRNNCDVQENEDYIECVASLLSTFAYHLIFRSIKYP